MSTPTIDRLKWIAEHLARLAANDWLRFDGNQTYQEAMAELDDVIATFVDHSGEPAPVTLQAMTPAQLDDAIARFTASIPAAADPLTIIGPVRDAITTSQGAIIAACAPTPAPTTAPA